MSDNTEAWLDLHQTMQDSVTYANRQLNELQLAIVAEADGHTWMGAPIRVTVEFPKGLPSGFASKEEVRDWARTRLAELRERDDR